MFRKFLAWSRAALLRLAVPFRGNRIRVVLGEVFKDLCVASALGAAAFFYADPQQAELVALKLLALSVVLFFAAVAARKED
jgi:hypothetical protein